MWIQLSMTKIFSSIHLHFVPWTLQRLFSWTNLKKGIPQKLLSHCERVHTHSTNTWFWPTTTELNSTLVELIMDLLTNQNNCLFFPNIHTYYSRGKSLLESWGTTFLPDWQPPLIFVRFISNFLFMCANSMASAHVILK